MDVGWTPGIGVILPGISTRPNRQKPIDPLCIGQTPAHTQEVRIERSRPLIPFMEVAASRIGLPDLQECIRHWIATVVEHTTGHNDTLTNRLPPSPGIAGEICIFRSNGTDGRSGTGQL